MARSGEAEHVQASPVGDGIDYSLTVEFRGDVVL